jgi:hypothetical protein
VDSGGRMTVARVTMTIIIGEGGRGCQKRLRR